MYSSNTSEFTEIEIDGVVQPSVVASYTFDTIGEHTVKYTLVDSTTIGSSAFQGCTGLTSITIPSGVTNMGTYVFYNCINLVTITSLCSTAPTVASSTFRNVKTNGTLYVPSGSTGYDTWMGTGNYYLGKYSWTKVEQ